MKLTYSNIMRERGSYLLSIRSLVSVVDLHFQSSIIIIVYSNIEIIFKFYYKWSKFKLNNFKFNLPLSHRECHRYKGAAHANFHASMPQGSTFFC